MAALGQRTIVRPFGIGTGERRVEGLPGWQGAPLGWRETLFTYQNGVSQAVGMTAVGFLAPALVWASWWWSATTERPT